MCLHSGDRSWLKHQTLSSLADYLAKTHDGTPFVRIHRSTLINLDRVKRIEPYSKDSRLAVLENGTELPHQQKRIQAPQSPTRRPHLIRIL